MRRATRVLRTLLLMAALALSHAVAHASDGAIEINQASALVGGITPGDTPGFPVVLSEPGRYVLTGALVSDESADAIEITSAGVSLDLNGFAVSCVLSSIPRACSATGAATSKGIVVSSATGVRIFDGFVRDFGGQGIEIAATKGFAIERVQVLGNRMHGVSVDADSSGRIARSQMIGNTGSGIRLALGFSPVAINETTTDGNLDSGIYVDVSVVTTRVTVADSTIADGISGIVTALGCYVDGNGRVCPP